MIAWAVAGHQARAIHAANLTRQLKAQLAMDDGTLGADANHLRAWAIAPHPDARWVGVMEDDALPVAGFADQVDAALAVSPPADVVSLYLGQAKPRRWQPRIGKAIEQADQRQASWITSTHLLHAVAVAMRAHLVSDWLAWAPTSKLPIDERITAWCIARGHTVAYTAPSLVEHADWPTLIAHPDGQVRTPGRTAWRIGTRGTWTNQAVAM